MNSARLICAGLAWIGSCMFVWKDLTQLNSQSVDLYRLRTTALAWTHRVDEMQGGSSISKLKPNALRKLISMLKIGLDRGKEALSFYETTVTGSDDEALQPLLSSSIASFSGQSVTTSPRANKGVNV